MTENDVQYDVIVVGGGAAGLSGALLLSRARWRVLVVDDGAPRNAPADGVHNWLTRDGLPPAEIARIGRAEVAGYGGVVRDARVTDALSTPAGLTVTTADGAVYTGRRLLVTAGLTDEIPAVHGLAERWGSEVFGCPFCHAWEHRDTRIGVLSTGPHDLLKAHIARRWSDDVTLFLHTGPEPDDEQWAGFAARGISVVDGEVVATVDGADGGLAGLRLASGTVVPVDALTISPRAVARAGFLAGLGIVPVEHPSGLGAAVPAGPDGRTEVPGVWVAGNVTDPTATVPAAVAAGHLAAAGIARDLITDDVTAAVERRAVGSRVGGPGGSGGAAPEGPTMSGAGATAGPVPTGPVVAPADGLDHTTVLPARRPDQSQAPVAADPFSAAAEAECAARVAGVRVHGVVP